MDQPRACHGRSGPTSCLFETGLTMSATLLKADCLACLRGGRLVAGLVPAFAGTLDWTGAPGSMAYLGHQDAVKPALTPRETLRFWGTAAGAAPDAAAIDAALAA